MTETMPETGLSADFAVSLTASINGLAAEMRSARRARENLAADVSYVETPPIAFAALPYAAAGWGPNTGFSWAVQRVTVSGFGALSDFVNMFRGTNVAQAVGNNGLFTFQTAVVGGMAEWKPGRTGCILKAEESLVFGGTITGGATFFVNVDVIQVTDAHLPYFLL